MQPEALTRLVAVAKALSSYDELDSLAQVIVQVSTELTESEGSSLLLFDEEEGALRYVATSWCEDDAARQQALENVLVPARVGAAGWVMEHNLPVRAVKRGEDALVEPLVEALMPEPVTSVAAVPLSYRNVPIGVLEAFNHGQGRFDEEAQEVLLTLASIATVSIYNAHLLHRSQAAYAQLEELDQMKTDFIAISSHELRTPLGVIIGHTAVLKEISDQDIVQQLEVIERNARQLQEIIENLSTINDIDARRIGETLTIVDLNDQVAGCLRRHADLAGEKGVVLQADTPPEILYARAAPEKIAAILNSLVRNALAFMDEERPGKVLITLKSRGGEALVSVIDNGIGIPEKDRARIFERFYQVEGHMRRRHGGLGVGLTAAKYLVELFGGRIWVDSVEGRGSSFSFALPLAAPETKISAIAV